MDFKELFKKTRHYFFQIQHWKDHEIKDNFFRAGEQKCKEGSHVLKADKKWGAELMVCRRPHACKIMILEPDTQVSMHWHEEKSESFVLIEGEMVVETIILATGHKDIVHLKNKFDSITLPPRVPHTFYCPVGQETQTVFIEASSEDNSYDNYRVFSSVSNREEDPDNGGSDS